MPQVEFDAKTPVLKQCRRRRGHCDRGVTEVIVENLITFFFNLCGGTLGTAATAGLLYQPQMIGDGDCGEIGGMKIGRGNRSTRRKPAPALLLPPQIPHD
jgi:hypothetical protein